MVGGVRGRRGLPAVARVAPAWPTGYDTVMHSASRWKLSPASSLSSIPCEDGGHCLEGICGSVLTLEAVGLNGLFIYRLKLSAIMFCVHLGRPEGSRRQSTTGTP